MNVGPVKTVRINWRSCWKSHAQPYIPSQRTSSLARNENKRQKAELSASTFEPSVFCGRGSSQPGPKACTLASAKSNRTTSTRLVQQHRVKALPAFEIIINYIIPLKPNRRSISTKAIRGADAGWQGLPRRESEVSKGHCSRSRFASNSFSPISLRRSVSIVWHQSSDTFFEAA